MDPSQPWEWYHYERVTNWTRYYQIIQTANILIDKLNEGIHGVSDTQQARYLAEATYMRCFTYFWMVRLYGDVVYYTAPYQADRKSTRLNSQSLMRMPYAVVCLNKHNLKQ